MSDDELKALNNLRTDILLSYYFVSPEQHDFYEIKEPEYTKTEKIINNVKNTFSGMTILFMILLLVLSLFSVGWIHENPLVRKEMANNFVTGMVIGALFSRR